MKAVYKKHRISKTNECFDELFGTIFCDSKHLSLSEPLKFFAYSSKSHFQFLSQNQFGRVVYNDKPNRRLQSKSLQTKTQPQHHRRSRTNHATMLWEEKIKKPN